MTTLFILYLVLLDKPRFEDTNQVASYDSVEKCQESADKFNLIHAAQLGDGGKSSFAWVCREVKRN